jgi:hypothetical protein
MKLREFITQLKNAVTGGAENALGSYGIQQAACTKAEAYRLYGRSNIDRWLTEGLLIPDSKNRLDKVALAQIAARSNRTTYLPVAER